MGTWYGIRVKTIEGKTMYVGGIDPALKGLTHLEGGATLHADKEWAEAHRKSWSRDKRVVSAEIYKTEERF